jgi:glutamate/aspartate transport system substrate-binding protein
MLTRAITLLATCAVACVAVTSLLTTPAAAGNEPPATAAANTYTSALSGTLDKAKNTGTITIAYRLANVPFSYLDSSLQPTGYTKELCDRIVEKIRQQYNMPHLKIVYVPVEAKDRVEQLRNGASDLGCGPSVVSPELQKDVDFSITYFISHVRLLTRKDYHFQNLNSLENKTITVTTGTAAERELLAKLGANHYNIAVLPRSSHSTSFLMVKSGRAAAYALDDILLAGLIAHSRDPNAYEIVGPNLSTARYALMLRKGDTQLKAFINKTLASMMTSGEAGKLYERWFMRPIPPSGININLPMSEELVQVFANPLGLDETTLTLEGDKN